MITPTITAADRCPYCHHPILTAFVYIQAVRGTNIVVTAHARCTELAASDLPADQLAAAKAEHLAGLAGVETLFPGAPFAQPAQFAL